jgi:hypothetical protein
MSFASTTDHRSRITEHGSLLAAPGPLLGLLAGLSLGVFLLASRSTFQPGFPLDDAWIHQTYARSLAHGAGWVYWPGEPSAGSTAPLWSLLLVPGHLLGLNPLAWAFFLGWLSLWGLAWTGGRVYEQLHPAKVKNTVSLASRFRRPALLAGALLAFEWHLAWAAGSGMETLLFAGIVLAVLGLLFRLDHGRLEGWKAGSQISAVSDQGSAIGDRRSAIRHTRLVIPNSQFDNHFCFLTGLLIGLSAWVRPDGITLLGPAALVLLLGPGAGWAGLRRLGLLIAGFALLFIPYLAFNRALAGAWWPNTFFAKGAEYAAHRQLPLWERLAAQGCLPLVGAGALLLPGFAWFTWQAIRLRSWARLAAVLWAGGFLASYALRLPVTYQHGRYAMPAMPVYFLCGLAGMAGLARWSAEDLWPRALSRAWVVATVALLLVFWTRGAGAYAQDVAVIQTEMVAAARWVADNTDPQALVAAHDIGALGYFGERELLDLAGLVSPEVIPFIRDEAALARHLDARAADYLVAFPRWYPQLTAGRQLLFRSGGRFSPLQGGENMAVYAWRAGR